MRIVASGLHSAVAAQVPMKNSTELNNARASKDNNLYIHSVHALDCVSVVFGRAVRLDE